MFFRGPIHEKGLETASFRLRGFIMRSLELFSGAGGLAMGIGKAGFDHVGVVEFNHDACETMRANRGARGSFGSWPVVETDVRNIADFGVEFGPVDLLAGGPPCQPFSLGGKAQGAADPRDMFPETVRAIRQTQPLAFIVENVKGLTRRAFSTYFEYIFLQMSYPTVIRKKEEPLESHRRRLERIHTQGKGPDLQYRVVWALLQAADYGVPQRRERVFFVGFRKDIHVGWSFPPATHSRLALLRSKASGDYFDRHGILCPDSWLIKPSGEPCGLAPWRTVRDALQGLPDPEQAPDAKLQHVFIPGARSYPGHTGSPLDEPAKTLKAGDHGVPGGENMIVKEDGAVRYLTLREAARIQTFPEKFRFPGSWTESMRQLGNAVPVRLGEVVAKSVAKVILPISQSCNA
jgi:DNA (cytosine-5)-methyltransferase 1